jgi:hypothetical protein
MRTRPRIIITAAALLLAAIAGETHATLITDYCDYGGTAGMLADYTTSNTTGWSDNFWSNVWTTPLVRYSPESAAFVAVNGEDVTYSNWYVGGSVLGSNTLIGTVARGLSTPLDGTIWVSAVVSCSFWNATPDFRNSGRIFINDDTNDCFGAACGGTSPLWCVFENGTVSSNKLFPSAAAAPNNACSALLVAKLRTDYNGTDDELSLWFYDSQVYTSNLTGRTVAGLGTPVYVTSTAQDIWGSAISNLGIITKSVNASGRFFLTDSLRISHGTWTDDAKVYEVLSGEAIPEPAVAFGAAVALLVVRRARAAALTCAVPAKRRAALCAPCVRSPRSPRAEAFFPGHAARVTTNM